MSDPVSLKTAPLAGQALSSQFGARLLDLTGETTPWQRRLWSVGTVLALRELHEAGTWVDAQVVSPAALQWLCRDLERLAGDDAGLGTPEVRKQLREALRADLSRHSRYRRRLHELIAIVDELYISRWTAAADDLAAVSSERLARAIVAHLLDRGYSMGFLHRTLRRRIAAGSTVGDFLAEAARLASASPRRFQVMVPFLVIPQQQLAEGLPQWRTGPQVRDWLAAHAPGDAIRQNGAFLYSVDAMDPYAAGRKAGEILDHLLARSSFLRRRRSGLTPLGRLWVAGLDESLPLEPPARGVDILSLRKDETLYRIVDEDLLDKVLELAAPLNRGSRGAAGRRRLGRAGILALPRGRPGGPQRRSRDCRRPDGRPRHLLMASSGTDGPIARAQAGKSGPPGSATGDRESNRERAVVIASALRSGRVIAPSILPTLRRQRG